MSPKIIYFIKDLFTRQLLEDTLKFLTIDPSSSMNLEQFLSKIKAGERVTFSETMAIIEQYFYYYPTCFNNGSGSNQQINEAGTNEGSCKIFAFAQLQRLTQTQTLALFGDYYWQDVLKKPENDNHANIRIFMREGWAGINFFGQALTPRQ